jgi:hypothetical protein
MGDTDFRGNPMAMAPALRNSTPELDSSYVYNHHQKPKRRAANVEIIRSSNLLTRLNISIKRIYIAPSASESEVEAASKKLQVKLSSGLIGGRMTPVHPGNEVHEMFDW